MSPRPAAAKTTTGAVPDAMPPLEQRLEYDPFADETVERRQPDDRHRSHQEGCRRQRHPPRHAAQLVDHPGARGPHHRPAPRNRRLLKSAWLSVCSTAPVSPSTATTGCW